MSVIQVLQDLKQGFSSRAGSGSVLLGLAHNHGATILGSAHCEYTRNDLQDVADALPAPMGVLGVYSEQKSDALQAAVEVQKSGVCEGLCLALFILDGQCQAARLQQDGALGSIFEVKIIRSFDDWIKDNRIFRCELQVSLDVVDDGVPHLDVALQGAASAIVRQLEAPGLSYLVEAGPSGRTLISRDTNDNVDTFLTPSAGAKDSATGTVDVVSCAPLWATTHLAKPPSGPVFTFHPLARAAAPGSSSGRDHSAATAPVCRSTTLHLDTLCYVPRACTLGTAVASLAQATVRQVQIAQRVLAKQGRVVPVRAYHFLPPGWGHHLTLLYPTLLDDPERNDEQLRPLRQGLHGLLGLPPNRPLLRTANALQLRPDVGLGGGDEGSGGVARLRDVHVGLSSPGIGGVTALVQGSYEYCHYMQGRFNDAGWGCAYRSLQTLCSWFRLQKYTSKPVPSHRAMQQILVRLGDKPSSFVGSSNWIGAIELSYILDDYLGVSSKFLTINRGADIPSHARQLAEHFETVGTPVMIGGGVLAYTLLGVRFNEQTGEAAFLILDPHYTGGEDLRKIHQGTWVGWKRPGDNAAAGGPLFVEDAFYNFLLPQRPNTV